MIFKIITAVLGILLVSLIAIANSGNGTYLLSFVHVVPHGDKWLHLLLMGSITAALNLSLDFRTWNFRGRNLLAGSMIVAILITCEEFSQGFNPHRNFEILDLVCNYLGVFVIGQIPFFLKIKYPGLFEAKAK